MSQTPQARPFHQWCEDVATEGGLSAKDREILKAPLWRHRLSVWWNAGETVAGAIAMLRVFLPAARKWLADFNP